MGGTFPSRCALGAWNNGARLPYSSACVGTKVTARGPDPVLATSLPSPHPSLSGPHHLPTSLPVTHPIIAEFAWADLQGRGIQAGDLDWRCWWDCRGYCNPVSSLSWWRVVIGAVVPSLHLHSPGPATWEWGRSGARCACPRVEECSLTWSSACCLTFIETFFFLVFVM